MSDISKRTRKRNTRGKLWEKVDRTLNEATVTDDQISRLETASVKLNKLVKNIDDEVDNLGNKLYNKAARLWLNSLKDIAKEAGEMDMFIEEIRTMNSGDDSSFDDEFSPASDLDLGDPDLEDTFTNDEEPLDRPQ